MKKFSSQEKMEKNMLAGFIKMKMVKRQSYIVVEMLNRVLLLCGIMIWINYGIVSWIITFL